MGFEPTSLRDLAGRSNHLATGDFMVSRGEMWVKPYLYENQSDIIN